MSPLMCISVLVILYLTWYIIDRLRRVAKVGRYDRRYVFITGCDSGFGYEAALRLASKGFNVFAGCLTEVGTRQFLKTDKIRPVRLDVTDHESVLEAYNFVMAAIPDGGGLWGLINNAGIANTFGPVEWLEIADYQKILAVNLYGTIDMTKTFLPLLKAARGRVVNVSSVFGLITTPGAIPYCISKHGVESYSDNIRVLLRSTGIKVSLVEPFPFDTKIGNEKTVDDALWKLYESQSAETKKAYGKEYVEKTIDRVKRRFSRPASKRSSLVIDAFESALTARLPKTRYLVYDVWNTYHVFVWSLLMYLPTCITDILYQGVVRQPSRRILDSSSITRERKLD